VDALQRADLYFKQGWCPVPWAHHPKPIKDALRYLRYRPQIKQCWSNCQRLFSENVVLGLGLELELREGYVMTMIPFAHCWLIYQGEILDLTLPPENRQLEYLDSYEVTYPELLESMYRTGSWGPTDRHRLGDLHPLRPSFEKLQEFMDEHGEPGAMPEV